MSINPGNDTGRVPDTDCRRCLGTGEWVACWDGSPCKDDCLIIGCPDCGARIDGEDASDVAD